MKLLAAITSYDFVKKNKITKKKKKENTKIPFETDTSINTAWNWRCCWQNFFTQEECTDSEERSTSRALFKGQFESAVNTPPPQIPISCVGAVNGRKRTLFTTLSVHNKFSFSVTKPFSDNWKDTSRDKEMNKESETNCCLLLICIRCDWDVLPVCVSESRKYPVKTFCNRAF